MIQDNQGLLPTYLPVSNNIPAASKKFSRNVKLIIGAAALTAFSTLYYTLLRKPIMFHVAHTVYIRNSIKCQNEPENSLMPGCSNNVYCIANDPRFEKLNYYYPVKNACVNNKGHFMLNASKECMNSEVAKYLNSTSYAKQIFDKILF